ncbi:hypothetical protein [Arsenicicoccus bolidensis]|uniref:4Fe-4S Wbl-type domain-containing protein n=1 Tax=Arsenicicoccus bolidensis TaxID=229480 RepID=A0ABS9PYW9_9MICO|nr:hypothetical protein [Arsenicicoccus bolidensis]MCG7320809.1 hypothetical protein [Arsenicicoccus bolidensis]
MTRDAWTLAAACAGRPDLPWTTDAAHVPNIAADAMRSVCDACPVVLDCLAAVDTLDVTGGWWASTDRDPDAAPIGSALNDRDAVAVVWTSLRTGSGRVVGAQGSFDLFAAIDTLNGLGGVA